MSAADNIRAAVQAVGDAGDENKQIAFGTPGSKVRPDYPGAEATDTGKLWEPGEWVDELVEAVGVELDALTNRTVSKASFYGDPTGAANTALPIPGAPVKMAGATSGILLSSDFTHPTPNRLRYTGTDTKTFMVVAATSLSPDAVLNVLKLLLYKNAAPTLWGNGTAFSADDAGIARAVGLVALVTLATNDYLELWLEASVACNCFSVWRNMVVAELL